MGSLHCGGCHKADAFNASPSLKEVAGAYQGKEDQLIKYLNGEAGPIVKPAEVQLSRHVAGTAADTEVTMDIIRDRKEKAVKVRIGTMAQEEEEPTPKEETAWGLAVQEVTPQLAEQLGLCRTMAYLCYVHGHQPVCRRAGEFGVSRVPRFNRQKEGWPFWLGWGGDIG